MLSTELNTAACLVYHTKPDAGKHARAQQVPGPPLIPVCRQCEIRAISVQEPTVDADSVIPEEYWCHSLDMPDPHFANSTGFSACRC